MNNQISIIPILAAILSNVLWGSTFMASKVVLAQCPPITAITIRFVVALTVFLLFAVITKHDFQFSVFKNRFSELLLLGLIGYTSLYFFQMIALTKITSVQSSAIMLLAPLFTLIISFIESRTLSLRNISVIGFSFFGAGLIFLDHNKLDYSNTALSGLLFTLFASLCLGWSVSITKRLLIPKNHELQLSVFNLTFYSLLIGTIFLALIATVELGQPSVHFNLNRYFWAWVFYLGVICSSIAFFLWNWSIKKISPVVVAATMYLKTPVALLIGAMTLSEKLGFIFYLGTFIIFLTLFLNQIFHRHGVKR